VDRATVQALLGALCDYCLLRGDLYRLGEISEMAQAQQARQSKSGPDEDRSVLVRSVQWRTGIAARQLGELDKARSTLTSVVDLYFEAQHPAAPPRAGQSRHHLHHQGNLREAERRLREALEIQSTPELDEDRAWTLHRARRRPARHGPDRHGARAAARVAGAAPPRTRACRVSVAHLQSAGVSTVRPARPRRGGTGAAGQSYALARDPRGSA